MTRVALLWHMHQPFYEDLVTGEHILPWVRLHALKDYYGMVALLREFPRVKATFNLVPSLLVQLEDFAGGRARDRDLDLSLKPAADLDGEDVAFIRENFFHAQRQRMIDPYPRYAELFARRAAGLLDTSDTDALRDLQVWHKLAWIDPSYLDADPRVRDLVARGRGFSEDDKRRLGEVELELLNRVIPEYREAAARGQIEISASPFYHPILPLLCDTDIYLRTHPEARRPRRRFAHPEDAADQLERAAACHERLFGRRPEGLWPSEGSVSDAMVPLVASAGFRWMATDEQILEKTLGTTLTRDGRGQSEQPEHLYKPYVVRAGGAAVACAFRDHVLSDLIGFAYAGWPAEAAADDLVGRLAEAGRRFQARSGGEEAFIPVILDGENAWEHFEGGGRPFLRALYSRLSEHPEVQTVTMAEGCRSASRELRGIFPGSWIDANFSIWIGHADDQKAWSQLADVRAALDQPGSDAPDRDAAREEIFIAEGSDWCWWYGDDHSSAHDAVFDGLFRRHLRNAYRLMGKPAPDELFVTNMSTGVSGGQIEPTALLAPTLDGEETSYFEWMGAGSLPMHQTPGAMHQTAGASASLTLVRFGFDLERLWVRLDATRPMVDLLADGHQVCLRFLAPPGVRFSVQSESGRLTGAFWHRPSNSAADQPWSRGGIGGATLAAGHILEVALPLADLGVSGGSRLSFFVLLCGGGEVNPVGSDRLDREPAHPPIETAVPDGSFEGRNWRP
jgi:alpha-amylase/alpha-mannosidase (GH57 family)